jgi:hypothetical protein
MSRTLRVLGSLVLVFAAVAGSGGRVAGAVRSPATPAAGITCGTPTDEGLIVYLDIADPSATPRADGYTSAFVVFAPDGTVVHRVPLADLPTFSPLGVGCAILGNAPTLGSFLFDPVSGRLQSLVLPEDYGDSLFPLTGWQRTYREQRWAFLTDNPATHALLVDTRTAHVTDLAALARALRDDTRVVVFLAATFSPDESSFLLVTDRDTWLVPTAEPNQARRLPNASPGPASYSSDGKRILYVAQTGETTSDVVVENLDGSGHRVLAAGGRHAGAFWVPGTNDQELLLTRYDRNQSTVAVLADGKESALATLPAGTVLLPPMFSPSGRRALVGTRADSSGWLWVDLDAGTARSLDALDGYPSPYAPYAPGVRWLQFFPSATPTVLPGTSVRGLDLETGTVATLLTFGFKEPYPGMLQYSTYGSSPDGRYVAINDFGKHYPRFWLLDAESRTATLFAGRIAGSFSPDGRYVIVAERTSGAPGRLWRTLAMTVAGRDVRTLAVSVGRGGFWVPGTHSR